MEHPVVFLLAAGTLLTEISIIAYLGLKILNRFTDRYSEKISRVENIIASRYREIGFSLSLIATSGSLYLSNILGWTPCHLCWFQRIFMYPLVILFGVSLLLDKKSVSDYVLPLSLIGASISTYHFLVQFLPKLQSSTCSITEVSCQSTYTFYFGHITIPVMAGAAFLAITVACYENFSRE